MQLHAARNNQPRLSVAHSVQQQPFAIARNGRGKPPAVGVKSFPAIRSVNAGKVRGAQRIQRNFMNGENRKPPVLCMEPAEKRLFASHGRIEARLALQAHADDVLYPRSSTSA